MARLRIRALSRSKLKSTVGN
ncbi:uncharacterized protein G2W53_026186 [Senna tora]|uniref:Uncharacterized protein n=1 Tax=Senna tora TaxID=362788 RepID=A0A834WIK2_9FABA|nr:uncharacterized protein G2W53_026186 [Senna tora]